MKLVMNLLLLMIGFLSGLLLTGVSTYADWTELPDGRYVQGQMNGFVSSLSGVPEQPGPQDRIPERAIAVYGDRVVLDIQNAQWSTFTDTNSMDPVIDQGANAIQVVPQTADEIEIGDIISYTPQGRDVTIIHRVIEKGVDEQGTYFIAKGDNLARADPDRIRFTQIKRVLVAIIY